MTALTATFSAVIVRTFTGSTPMSWSGAMPAQSSMDRTRSGVGAMIGRPSVQERDANRSLAAISSATTWVLGVTKPGYLRGPARRIGEGSGRARGQPGQTEV